MRVGVVPGDAGGVRAAVRAAGGTAVDAAASPDVVAAVGTEALAGIDDRGDGDDDNDGRPPVLLVDGDATGGPAVAPDDVEAAVGAVIDRDRDPDRAVPTVSQPRLEVWTPQADRTAALDVTLQTVEPARISEFGVRLVDDGRTPDTGESDRRPDRSAEPGERLARLRADGVVVATPAGSHGYPRSAGGPRLVGGRAAVVVPIAPFVVDPDTWVTPLSDRRVRVTVERDEATVGLFVDGHEVGTVDHDTPVVIGDDGDLRLVDGRRLERH